MKMLCIYADYKSDESYTPSKISVRVGNNFHNLQEIRVSLCFCGSDRHSCWMLKPSNCFIFVSAAAGDGGAQRLDSHLSTKSGKNIQILFLDTAKTRSGVKLTFFFCLF